MRVKFIFFSPQVPTVQFAGYVTSMVEDLYKTLEAAIQGTITGGGTLGTVLLCETLLSHLPTSCTWNQPYSVLNAYGVTPRGVLALNRRIDLRAYVILQNDVMYVPRAMFVRVWVPLNSLVSSARATAIEMLKFLEQLHTGRTTVRHPLRWFRSSLISSSTT